MFRRITATLLLALVLLYQPICLVRDRLVTVSCEKDAIVDRWDPPKSEDVYFPRNFFSLPAHACSLGDSSMRRSCSC